MDDTLPASSTPSDSVRDVAHAQRRVLLGVLANIVANVLLRTTAAGDDGNAAVLALTGLIVVAAVVFNMYWVYRLCKALGMTPWIYVIAMLIPLIGLLCLVLLNQRATTFLKANGLKVGFLGTKV